MAERKEPRAVSSSLNAIVFDLDGTLVDSLAGIECSLRWAVGQSLTGRSFESLRPFIGPPIHLLAKRLWPDLGDDEVARVAGAFREHYDNEGCRETALFEGVAETLGRLAEKGIALFVLTNKPLRPSLAILEATGIRRHFRGIVSPDTRTPRFDRKSEGALWLRQEYDLQPMTTWLVGDGVDDAEAAEAAGFCFIAAAYGYGGVEARSEFRPWARIESFPELERHV